MSLEGRPLLRATQPATGTASPRNGNPVAAGRPPVKAAAEWGVNTPDGAVHTQSLHSISHSLNKHAAQGALERLRPIGTGFEALDHWIGGGIRQGELVLLGGAQGVGKTTFCLQIARNIAASGGANVLYACYEHPPEYILNRLLVQETIDPAAPGPAAGLTLDQLQAFIVEAQRRQPGSGLYDALRLHPAGARSVEALEHYSARFHLVADAARKNGLEELTALVEAHRAHDNSPLVLFVDYLQKVEARDHDSRDESEQVTEVVQGLKQLALHSNVAVVAIVAADKEGLRSARLRFTHLRGSSALMYEADIAVIMNDKWSIIDRDHIVFNQHKAQQFRDWIVCTVEKNRSGRNLVEVEFQKRFEYCCFNPRGGKVSERLYEERIQGES